MNIGGIINDDDSVDMKWNVWSEIYKAGRGSSLPCSIAPSTSTQYSFAPLTQFHQAIGYGSHMYVILICCNNNNSWNICLTLLVLLSYLFIQ